VNSLGGKIEKGNWTQLVAGCRILNELHRGMNEEGITVDSPGGKIEKSNGTQLRWQDEEF
jgi:hypothetical protein